VTAVAYARELDHAPLPLGPESAAALALGVAIGRVAIGLPGVAGSAESIEVVVIHGSKHSHDGGERQRREKGSLSGGARLPSAKSAKRPTRASGRRSPTALEAPPALIVHVPLPRRRRGRRCRKRCCSGRSRGSELDRPLNCAFCRLPWSARLAREVRRRIRFVRQGALVASERPAHRLWLRSCGQWRRVLPMAERYLRRRSERLGLRRPCADGLPGHAVHTRLYDGIAVPLITFRTGTRTFRRRATS